MKFVKFLLKLLVWCVVLGGILLIGVYLLQGVLMYPGKSLSASSDFQSRLAAVANRGFTPVHVPSSEPDKPYRALWVRCNQGTAPALLWFHGRSEDITELSTILTPMRDLGFHVLAMEYPGYGDAPGEISESTIMTTAEAAFDFLDAKDEVAPRQIVAGGFELGAAVALKLATRRPVAGVLAVATLPKMETAVAAKLKGLPVGFLLKDKFDIAGDLDMVRMPVLFVHGSEDSLVPASSIDALSLNLTRTRVLRVDGAPRKETLLRLTKEQWDEIGFFVQNGLR